MISEALQRPIGPLAAWQWGLVIGGGYLGYRVLSGKSVFPSGGTSSTGTPADQTNATGGITQGPQGDPGPVGPPGPPGPGPIGTTTSTAARIKTLEDSIAILTKDVAINKKAGKTKAAATDQATLDRYKAELAALLNPGPVFQPGTTPVKSTTPMVGSFVNPPSTTIGNSAGNPASLVMPSPSTAVTISHDPIASPHIPVSAGTGA